MRDLMSALISETSSLLVKGRSDQCFRLRSDDLVTKTFTLLNDIISYTDFSKLTLTESEAVLQLS
jgi:hypothetical protein